MTKVCKNKYFVYDSCISPQQQPEDEVNAPPELVEKGGLKSNGKSIPRELRKERGYGKLVIKKDLTKCYVYIYIKNLESSNIKLLHIHAGVPGVLGPVIVDLGMLIDIKKDLEKGYVKIIIKNKDVGKINLEIFKNITNFSAEGLPINVDGIQTSGNIATLDSFARLGLLYFNFHNDAELFYGIMRGQIYPINN
jgi:hypothetical protein